MTSKMGAPSKRAALPRTSDHTKDFVQDWERRRKAGRSDLAGAKVAMLLIVANDGPLPPQYKDHDLTGDWSDHRDCHIHGDFLMIYRLEDKGRRVVFVRLGSHSEIFG